MSEATVPPAVKADLMALSVALKVRIAESKPLSCLELHQLSVMLVNLAHGRTALVGSVMLQGGFA